MAEALRPLNAAGTEAGARRFLDAFFAPPNRLSRAACEAGSGKQAAKFAPWVRRVYGPEPVVTVLPRWNTDNSFDWYGLATDPTDLRRLGEELTAFVGPTWSTFRGSPASLDPRDPIDRAVAEFTGGAMAFKFRDGNDPARVFAALEVMRRAWGMRPAVTADAPRPVGRVLRDFYMAVRAGNRDSAEAQLAYLGRRGQLNELNRLFLRVQMLAELSEPAALLSLPGLGDLLQARRPLAVTQALLSAAYAAEIAPAEAGPPQALERCRAVAWKYGPLFASDVGIRQPNALKFFMLRAASLCDPALRDRLLAVPVDGATRDLLESFARLFPTPAIPADVGAARDPLAAATAAIDAGDFGSAFNLARAAERSLRRAVILCHCAYEAPSLVAEQEALDAISMLPPADYDAALRRRLIREFVETATVPPAAAPAQATSVGLASSLSKSVTNWVQWLERLYAGELGVSASEVARQGGEQWDVQELSSSAADVARFAELLGTPPERWALAVNEALPHILGFFQRDPEWPRKAYGPVYGAAAAVLAQTTSGATDDLTLFNDLASARLETGASKAEYVELLEQLRLLGETFAAPATVEWLLDALELLAFQPCPDDDARRQFLRAAGTHFYRYRARLTKDHRWLLGRLHVEMNEADLFANLLPTEEIAESVDATPGEASEDPLRRYARKSIAIYTLNDRAAQVVAELLRNRVPNVTVHTNNDLAGTPRLKALAQQTDVFVMTLGSAKHAATDFIADNRPAGKALLRTGKRSRGSSGILLQLVKHAEEEVGVRQA